MSKGDDGDDRKSPHVPPVKARTPRAQCPPDSGLLTKSIGATLEKKHGGHNFVESRDVLSGRHVYHMLGILTTTVLMGYRHDRIKSARAVVNDDKKAWHLLGNSIQGDALAYLMAPFVARLAALHRESLEASP